MERRYIDQSRARVAIEMRADGKGGEEPIIAGYAAVFYDGTPGTEYVLWDDAYGRAVERVMPGAFDLTRSKDVRGLFNHDANQVLGRTVSATMKLSIDDKGLRYEITPAETSTAKDLVALIQRGDVSGSSFSFSIMPEGQKWTQVRTGDRFDETRELLKVDLWDVGPVTFPAYDATTSELRASELRETRTVLREMDRCGASIDQARARVRLVELEAEL